MNDEPFFENTLCLENTRFTILYNQVHMQKQNISGDTKNKNLN